VRPWAEAWSEDQPSLKRIYPPQTTHHSQVVVIAQAPKPSKNPAGGKSTSAAGSLEALQTVAVATAASAVTMSVAATTVSTAAMAVSVAVAAAADAAAASAEAAAAEEANKIMLDIAHETGKRAKLTCGGSSLLSLAFTLALSFAFALPLRSRSGGCCTGISRGNIYGCGGSSIGRRSSSSSIGSIGGTRSGTRSSSGRLAFTLSFPLAFPLALSLSLLDLGGVEVIPAAEETAQETKVQGGSSTSTTAKLASQLQMVSA
jgi:hypothetical protein